MVVNPTGWFAFVPGVSESGPMNTHFIVDVGLAYLGSGAGFLVGAWPGPRRAAFALAGATWPVLHAAFHIWGWITDGIPSAPENLLSQLFGVVGLALVGGVLAVLRLRMP